jgi:hypothetical protein
MLRGVAADVCNSVIKINPFFIRGNKKGVVPDYQIMYCSY